MKLLRWLLICGIFAAVSVPAMAASDAVQTMTAILIEMNHFPSDEQRAVLTSIADDSDQTENVRRIARAIASIAHQAAEEEKESMNAVLADQSATSAEQALARAVNRFNHQADPDDVEALRSLHE
jgi:hypothetical protein